jgi:hypothetical protein
MLRKYRATPLLHGLKVSCAEGKSIRHSTPDYQSNNDLLTDLLRFSCLSFGNPCGAHGLKNTIQELREFRKSPASTVTRAGDGASQWRDMADCFFSYVYYTDWMTEEIH